MSMPPKRNLQLDILRGIAILLVLGAHINLELPEGPLGRLGNLWYTNGALGVDLFFVLSGFLVGGLLLAEHSKHGRVDVTRFLIRRGFKIYPLYFVFLGYLVAMPTAKAVLGGGNVGATLARLWHDYWPNILFIQNYVGPNPAGHTWSLANEEHFYLLLPPLVLLLIAAGRIRSILKLAVYAVPFFILVRSASIFLGDPFAAKMNATHLRIDALLFGVGIRALAEYHPQVFARLREWRVGLAIAGVVLWIPAIYRHDLGSIYSTVGFSFTMFGSAALILATYHTHREDFGRWAQPAVSLATFLAWIGSYSYGIYVWHVTIIRILERTVVGRIIEPFVDSGILAWILGLLVVSAGAIVGGMIISRLVEIPALRVRDRLFPSRSAGLPAPSQTAPSPAESSQQTVAVT